MHNTAFSSWNKSRGKYIKCYLQHKKVGSSDMLSHRPAAGHSWVQIFGWTHICKPCKETMNRFPTWRNRFLGIDSARESIPRLLKRLQIRALVPSVCWDFSLKIAIRIEEDVPRNIQYVLMRTILYCNILTIRSYITIKCKTQKWKYTLNM
jgi:hypothetical protein